MPRPLRPVADRLIYHVINRGNNRQAVFRKAGDFQAFLDSLSALKDRKPFDLFGYCLLNNHFHLLIRPIETTISRLVQSLLVSHTHRYHKHYCSSGHVWQGRFKSPVIQDDEHVLTVLRYIEANPLRAGIVADASEYPWSSYRAHGRGDANALLSPLVTYEQLSPTPAARQRKWREKVHRPMKEAATAAVRRSVETGLPYGNPQWVTRLADKLDLDLTIRPRGRPPKQASK
jgi:REP-associated tyrosine transposase